MTYLKPRAIAAGDRVGIIAPASPFPRDEFEAGIAELQALGFVPVWDERLFARETYLAGGANERANAFLQAWRDPSIAAIVTVRGGYGSAHVLPYLGIEELRARPKMVVGYSDITAMLSFLTTRAGIVAVHGPTVAGRLSRGEAGYDRASFLSAVTGVAGAPYAIGGAGFVTVQSGSATGTLLGGNLTQLAATLGTPYAFDPEPGCILFLEDINERPYRLDRLLTQLDHAGILARASALIFGEMPGCHEADGSLQARDGVMRALGQFRGPIAWGLPSGHSPGAAVTLPLGVRASIEAGACAVLRIEEGAVA